MLCEAAFVVKSLKEVLSPNLIRNITLQNFTHFSGLVYYFVGEQGVN